MVIVETSVFTRQVSALLSDDDYRKLQVLIANHPVTGALIKGGGGLRKTRWVGGGHGKRGGVRVIYYWAVKQERVLMLFMYPKQERGDLTAAQVALLRKLVEEEYP